MAFTQPEKAFCVLEFAKTESWTVVQRAFRRKFGKKPPERKSIVRWHGKFITDGCLRPAKRTGRPSTSEDVIEQVRTAFQQSPRKSIRRASRELQCPKTIVWRVLRRRLHMTPYKLQLVQHLKETDKPLRRDFCNAMQQKMEDDEFDDRLVFSDKATFHVNGKDNKQMTSTWRSKINAHNIIQRNLIRHIHNNEYTIKKYIQIHNKECTEISPRDSCFARWGSSHESRDHCAAKIQHINIPRQFESQLRQQSTRKQRMVNDVTPFLNYAVIENYKEFCQSQAL